MMWWEGWLPVEQLVDVQICMEELGVRAVNRKRLRGVLRSSIAIVAGSYKHQCLVQNFKVGASLFPVHHCSTDLVA
jgi:hypothetical protein